MRRAKKSPWLSRCDDARASFSWATGPMPGSGGGRQFPRPVVYGSAVRAPNKGGRGGNGRQPDAGDKLVQMLELASHLTHRGPQGQKLSLQRGCPDLAPALRNQGESTLFFRVRSQPDPSVITAPRMQLPNTNTERSWGAQLFLRRACPLPHPTAPPRCLREGP